MTIGQKIIFSSTLVALLAALAAFMGWKNTQPIQTKLVETLTNINKEIRLLDDIKIHIASLQTELHPYSKIQPHQQKIAQEQLDFIHTQLQDLHTRITVFSKISTQPNHLEEIDPILALSRKIQAKAQLSFSYHNQLTETAKAAEAGEATIEVLDNLMALITNASNRRFEIIEIAGTNVQAQIGKLNFWIILVGGLTFLLAIIFGQLIARNLSQSLAKLRNTVHQLSEGNYATRTGMTSKDEFGMIGQNLDGIAANIQQAEIIEAQKLEVESLSEQLKIKNDSLDRFVYRVSHDLKAPILTIKSLLKLIQEKWDASGNEEVKKAFSFLEKSSDKLQQTVFDLLEVCRIEKSLETTKEWLSLEALVHQISTENEQIIAATKVQITCNFEVPQLYFSRANMTSLLSNLLTNGVKYQHPGRNSTIHLETIQRGDVVCLSIKDNGIGIDLERHKSKLFGMFNRFHDHVEGSGVGLYIVKKIIDEVNGTIEIESQPDIGTTFILYFPQKAKVGAKLISP